MQISRHWRMNAQRYRLTGIRTLVAATQPPRETQQPQPEQVIIAATRTRATAAR